MKEKAEENLLKQNAELNKVNRELDNFVYMFRITSGAPCLTVRTPSSCKKENKLSGSLEEYLR